MAQKKLVSVSNLFPCLFSEIQYFSKSDISISKILDCMPILTYFEKKMFSFLVPIQNA